MLRELDLTSPYASDPLLGRNFGIFSGNKTSTTSSSISLAFPGGGIVTGISPAIDIRSGSYQGTLPNEPILSISLAFPSGGVVTSMGHGVDIRPSSYQNVLLNEPAFETIERDHIGLALLLLLLGFLSASVTDYQVTYAPPRLPKTMHLPDTLSLPISPAEVLKPASPAERLRAVSGLDVEQLAKIFGISRTTYHKWINGSSTPRRKRREHLLEVFSLVEKAAQRLGSRSALSDWLLSPIPVTGKKPVEYLSMHQYAEFRGFLLQVRIGQEVFRSSILSNRAHRELSAEEVEDASERLRPRARVEEDDRSE